MAKIASTLSDVAYLLRQYQALREQDKPHSVAVEQLNLTAQTMVESRERAWHKISQPASTSQVVTSHQQNSIFDYAPSLQATESELPLMLQAWKNALSTVDENVTLSFGALYAKLAYLGYLMFMLVIVVSIYSLKVLPNYAHTFDALSVALPAFTQFSMGVMSSSGIFIVIGLLLLVSTPLIGLFILNVRVGDLKPAPRWLSYVPITERVVARYHELLVLLTVYIAHSAKAGSGLHQSVEKSASYFNFKQFILNKALERQLQRSEQLGTLTEEVGYQFDRSTQAFLLQCEKAQMVSGLIVQMAVFLLIGMLVVAMYLPIFTMGEVV